MVCFMLNGFTPVLRCTASLGPPEPKRCDCTQRSFLALFGGIFDLQRRQKPSQLRSAIAQLTL